MFDAERQGENARMEAVAGPADIRLDPNRQLERAAHEHAVDMLEQTLLDPFNHAPVDMIGSARLLSREQGAPREELQENLRRDIKTALFEILQESGHQSKLEARVNANGEAHINGNLLYKIFLNAMHPSRADWENQRTASNIYEEFLSAAHFTDEKLRQTHHLIVLSPLPDDIFGNPDLLDAEQKIKLNKELRGAGYREDTQKMMIRGLQFVPDLTNWKRLTDQISLSGSNVGLINQLLREMGCLADGEPDLTTKEILNRPLLLSKSEFPHGVVHLAEKYDQLLQRETGISHFCGKPSESPAELADYLRILHTSGERETAVDGFVQELQTLANDLAQNPHLTLKDQNEYFQKALLDVVRRICALYPSYAEHAFGEKAAGLYKAAQSAMANGDVAGSEAALGAAIANSTSVTMCGNTITQDEQAAAGEKSGYKTPQQQLEEFHCEQLKLFGKTIRDNVACPSCTVTHRGKKVRALETVETIECMNGGCGLKINKLTGKLLQRSRLDEVSVPPEATSRLVRAEEEKGVTQLINGKLAYVEETLGIGGMRRSLVDVATGTVISLGTSW